jgi:UrcA family protein
MPPYLTTRRLAAVTGFCVLMFTAQAFAGPITMIAPDQARVQLADLNLAAPQGVETAHHRVQAAARMVCGPDDDRTVQHRFTYRDCVSATTDRANAELDLRLHGVAERDPDPRRR